MSLCAFIEQVKSGKNVSFEDTMTIIAQHYYYTPVGFSNGLSDSVIINEAGKNEGSCKIFAFARLNGLDQQQTLNLFGDYYRLDVLNNPKAGDHGNIRAFMRDGWAGIDFKGVALTPK
ncbi:MAG: type III effector [Gammaproteobacteria bacterium HGW-Gammaproteobacteria-3]|nr:MAG: type III effector [Gammaproteobacteria bacterium HGW-Gammaproteobacteria-3]